MQPEDEGPAKTLRIGAISGRLHKLTENLIGYRVAVDGEGPQRDRAHGTFAIAGKSLCIRNVPPGKEIMRERVSGVIWLGERELSSGHDGLSCRSADSVQPHPLGFRVVALVSQRFISKPSSPAIERVRARRVCSIGLYTLRLILSPSSCCNCLRRCIKSAFTSADAGSLDKSCISHGSCSMSKT